MENFFILKARFCKSNCEISELTFLQEIPRLCLQRMITDEVEDVPIRVSPLVFAQIVAFPYMANVNNTIAIYGSFRIRNVNRGLKQARKTIVVTDCCSVECLKAMRV